MAAELKDRRPLEIEAKRSVLNFNELSFASIFAAIKAPIIFQQYKSATQAKLNY